MIVEGGGGITPQEDEEMLNLYHAELIQAAAPRSSAKEYSLQQLRSEVVLVMGSMFAGWFIDQGKPEKLAEVLGNLQQVGTSTGALADNP